MIDICNQHFFLVSSLIRSGRFLFLVTQMDLQSIIDKLESFDKTLIARTLARIERIANAIPISEKVKNTFLLNVCMLFINWLAVTPIGISDYRLVY